METSHTISIILLAISNILMAIAYMSLAKKVKNSQHTSQEQSADLVGLDSKVGDLETEVMLQDIEIKRVSFDLDDLKQELSRKK